MSTQHLPDGSEFLLRMVYSTREKQGVMVLVVVSCISLVAIVTLLSLIFLSAFNTRISLDEHLFVRTHVAAYFISLLFCDLLLSIGSVANARWINHMAVEFGSICVLQGILKQASDIGTAFWTVVIAMHTFCLLFLELKLRTFVLWTTLVGGWSAIAALVLLGPATLNTGRRGPFYGISGYWCWISPHHRTERLTLDYMIMFLAAFFSLVLYTLIFLRLRGNVVRKGWHVHFRRTGTADWQGRKFADDQTMAVARHMLLYPLAYIALVLPIASSRFATFVGHNVPFEATIFADVVFQLSGLVNVVLFTTTRRILPPVSRTREPPSSADGHGGDPYHQATHIQPDVKMNNSSRPPSLDRSSPGSSSSQHADAQRTRKEKSRPPDIIISRTSVESMYSVYEEDEVRNAKRSALQPQLSSQWSPDGSPQRRYV